MDLIYADINGKEIGVIDDYVLDIAFGRDENNFALELDMDAHCCQSGYFLFLEGTEYGGVVDKIEPDTKEGTVTYEGRTWHGIMNGKVIEPEEGQDYRIVEGEANAVLGLLLEELGLTGLFAVSEETSNVVIEHYQFERYTPAYKGILKMLFNSNGKLEVTYSEGKVVLNAVPLHDYSTDEEWDNSQFDFSIKKNYRPVNHLICLGSGNLSERKVIHLFVDENGGVMPYTTATPISDADYILDKSEQVLFGKDEVTEIYDYPNAQVTSNYVLLTEQPDGWRKNYTNYYYKDDGDFKVLERTYEDAYTALTAQPSNWSSKYATYYYKSGSKYKSVEGVESATYKKQKKKPRNWKKNYGKYFVYWSDGVTSEYKAVEGVKKYRYKIQTMKPSDWTETYKNYYEKVPVIKYKFKVKTKNAQGIWKKSEEILDNIEDAVSTDVKIYISYKKITQKWMYEKLSMKKAPKWKAKKYYTQESYEVAPAWKENYYYTETVTTTAPEWESGKYYVTTTVEAVPAFKKKTYYQLYLDNYADLVAGGLSRLAESYNCDEISIDLEPEQEYDINDIVGATEYKTGISVSQPITKKIVTIKDNVETIEYEIGE